MAFVRPFSRLRSGIRGAAWVLLSSLGFLSQSCLSQSYEISAPELARLVDLPAEERGESVRVTQQTSLGNDLRDVVWPRTDADVALLISTSDAFAHQPRERRRQWLDDADDEGLAEGAAEEVLAAAVVVAAVAATAAFSVGVTEGARFDGWMRAPEQHPVLLVDRWGRHRWGRLGALSPADLDDVHHAVLADFSDDLQPIERHPLDRQGFAYQLEFGTEPAPFDASSLAVSGRGALGFMPAQNYGFLIGAAFSTARAEQVLLASDTQLSVDYRVFLQGEAWPLSLGRWHLGPYAELGYAWALADDGFGSRGAGGPMLAIGGALQLDCTTRLALTLRGGIAGLPDLGGDPRLAANGYRLAPSVTLGISIY